VPGGAAPVDLDFQRIAGGKTGHHLPTGNAVDTVAGVTVTCLDISMPTVFVRADALGKTGHESPAELEGDRELLARIRSIREQASVAMGLGDARESVIPKFALIGPPQHRAPTSTSVTSRRPHAIPRWRCRPASASRPAASSPAP